MEEVLNSVKQKHREKHKRKREEKRRAALLAESGSLEKPHKDTKQDKEKPQPLREKSSQENGMKNGRRRSSPLKCSTPVADHQSILKHFAKAGKPENVAASPGQPASGKPKPTTNVFEFMMSARNRSIGVNEGGVESPAEQQEEEEAALPRRKRSGSSCSRIGTSAREAPSGGLRTRLAGSSLNTKWNKGLRGECL